MNIQEKLNSFLTKLTNKKGDEYTLEGEYKTMKTKTFFKHNVPSCGKLWETTPDNLLRTKKGCPHCAGNIKGTQESFLKDVLLLGEGHYVVVGDYENARTPIDILHVDCDTIYPVSPYSFKAGTRCPECCPTKPILSDDFSKKILPKYTMTGDYVNFSTNVECTCNECGKPWNAYPPNLYHGKSGCPHCAGNARITKEELEYRIEELHGNEYTLVSDVLSTSKKVTLIHNECGEPWNVTPSNLFAGKECPTCKRESKGERLVKRALSSLGVSFESQKKFDKCKYKKALPFDFFIPSINALIEYDGEQHFKPVNFGGRSIEESILDLKLVNTRDEIKNKFCYDNNIPLLRIPYTTNNKDIQKIVSEFVKEVTQGVSNKEAVI